MSTPLTIFNFGITTSFHGVFPDTVHVAWRHHNDAIRNYRRALNARIMRSAARTELRSDYGFTFYVQRANSNTTCSVRLSLPAGVNRASVARILARSGGVSHRREGLVVTDPYGVVWTLA